MLHLEGNFSETSIMSDQSLQKHKRETFRQIYLPVVIPVLLLVIFAVGMFALAMTDYVTAREIGVMAGLLGVVCVLLPLVLLMLVLDAALLGLALGAGYLRDFATQPLELAREYSQKGAELAHQTSERLATPIITARTKVAQWRYTISEVLGLPNHSEKFWDERK